jgi:hypothetical protein
MLMLSPYGFRNAWVIWGLAALILSVTIGAGLPQRAGAELQKRLDAGTWGDQRVGLSSDGWRGSTSWTS